tara:strand:+ start:183 stop:569 length:387 start_codon:yes stop_codon:yes gene_type:complete
MVNIAGVTNLKATTVGFALGTTVTTDLVTVSGSKLVRINTLLVSNVHATNAADVTVALLLADTIPEGITDFTNTGTFYIAKLVSVPQGSTLSILDTPLYLRAADILEGGASATSTLQLLVSYEVFDES